MAIFCVSFASCISSECERPAGRGLSALLAADWRVTGAFSTLLRRPGLRASSDGVLTTTSERKMLASTCLYSIYAWLIHYFRPLASLHTIQKIAKFT